MAIIPTGQQFHTLSSTVNTLERGSAYANASRESFTMQDILDTVSATGGGIDGSGTARSIPLFIDANTIGDSPLTVNTFTPGDGLAQIKFTDGYRFIINRPATVTSGDQEYAITQDDVNKVSFGWDDDGGGFGFLYNWAGFGWRIGAAGNNPMLEIVTTAGLESVNLHKQVKFIDYGSGTYTGTSAYSLAFDASGNVIETTPSEYTPADGNLLQGANPGTPAANPKKGTTAFGIGAAANLTTQFGVPGDAGNTAFGFGALGLEDSGGLNTAIGYKALGNQNVSSGFNAAGNTAVGYQAGLEATQSLGDTFVGTNIKSVNPGQSVGNVGVGSHALEELSTGFANVAIGRDALEKVTSNTGNIAIGYHANDGTTTGNENIVIGYNAQPSSTTVSNEITLGNSSTGVLRCQQTTITSLSDERDKTSIEDLPYGLDFVSKLQPRKFVWDNRAELRDKLNDDGTISKVEYYSANKGKKDFGFIAQEVKSLDNDTLRLVYEENPDKLEMSYGKLVPILVKAIQDLSAELDKKQDK